MSVYNIDKMAIVGYEFSIGISDRRSAINYDMDLMALSAAITNANSRHTFFSSFYIERANSTSHNELQTVWSSN